MRCEACGGLGRILCRPTPVMVASGVVGVVDFTICHDCRGTGQQSCCEGTERHAGVAGVDAPPFGQIIPFRRPDGRPVLRSV